MLSICCKNILKLKVLAITFDQFFLTETGIHNLNILREIQMCFHITINTISLKKVKKGFK